MTICRFVLVCLIGLWCTQGVAQTPMKDAFQNWVNREGMAPAAIVAFDPSGTMIAELSIDVSVTAPMPVASILKTIAGQCFVHLIDQGRLNSDDTMQDILGWAGPQGQVTITQLLTHSGGIGPDTTQRDVTGRLLRDPDRVSALISEIQTRPLTANIGVSVYNNENYLVLNAALDTVLEQDALDWCAHNTPSLARLTSLGRADALNALGFAGGLELSTMDLGHLFVSLEPSAGDWPTVQLDAINSYGPGIYVQSTTKGTNLFHIGGVCTMFGPNLGAYGPRLANGYAIAMTYSGCADAENMEFLNGFALELLRR